MWPYQYQWTCTQHGATPDTICHVSGVHFEEKEDPASLKDLLCLWFFFFLSSIILASPWSLKGKAGHPTKGTDRFNTPCITSHIAEQQPSSQHPFDLFIRDLELVPLSPICNPYYELFDANNTSSSHELDVGTFRLNQYKPCVFLAHHPGQTRNNTNLLVGVCSKHQQLVRQVGAFCAF